MNPPSPISRRTFLGAAASSASAVAALGGLPLRLAAGAPKPAQAAAAFPPDFWWGVSSAAYQVEGATREDGRGPCIWDTFCREPGRIDHGANADVASDQYHRYREDVGWMAELGVKHYRFSISWSRVLPDGRGAINEKGLDYYRRLVDTLREHGIEPHATLYHWDLPQALQNRYGGWQSREVANDFGHYASIVAGRLGDRIQHWMMLNEISSFCYSGGYGVGQPGHHAPGISLRTEKERRQVVHHALLAHGTGCLAVRAASPRPCQVAPAENFTSLVPIIATPEHIAATRRAFTRENLNGGILMPLLTGRYDEGWLHDMGASAPDIAPGDLELIGQPLDALGANCYSGFYVRAADNPKGYEILSMPEAYPKINMPWLNIVPEAIYWAIRMVGEAAGQNRLPIFISENGCPDVGSPLLQDARLDTQRLMYYRAYGAQLQRAVAEGYPVIGYFPWSLIDDFEWAWGYSKRFGLIHVDFATLKRTPKLGFYWYQNLIRTGVIG